MTFNWSSSDIELIAYIVILGGGILALAVSVFMLPEWIRSRQMRRFARELGCLFTRRKKMGWWQRLNRVEQNIIKGHFRDKDIEIYDVYEVVGAGEAAILQRQTYVNGTAYTGSTFRYVPIQELRRLIQNPTSDTMEALPSGISLAPGVRGGTDYSLWETLKTLWRWTLIVIGTLGAIGLIYLAVFDRPSFYEFTGGLKRAVLNELKGRLSEK